MSQDYIERLPHAAELLTRGLVAERIAIAQMELGAAQDTLTREWNEEDSATFETREVLYKTIDLLRSVVEALALRDSINYQKGIEEENAD